MLGLRETLLSEWWILGGQELVRQRLAAKAEKDTLLRVVGRGCLWVALTTLDLQSKSRVGTRNNARVIKTFHWKEHVFNLLYFKKQVKKVNPKSQSQKQVKSECFRKSKKSQFAQIRLFLICFF